MRGHANNNVDRRSYLVCRIPHDPLGKPVESRQRGGIANGRQKSPVSSRSVPGIGGDLQELDAGLGIKFCGELVHQHHDVQLGARRTLIMKERSWGAQLENTYAQDAPWRPRSDGLLDTSPSQLSAGRIRTRLARMHSVGHSHCCTKPCIGQPHDRRPRYAR